MRGLGDFTFGDPRFPTCCGKPEGCTNTDADQCPFWNHRAKRENDASADSGSSEARVMTISSRYAEVLAFEAAGGWRFEGTKTAIVFERFGWSMTRYYQVLSHALNLPEAAWFAPATTARLCRLRDARLAARRTTTT